MSSSSTSSHLKPKKRNAKQTKEKPSFKPAEVLPAENEFIFESLEQKKLREESDIFFEKKKKRRASSFRKKFYNDHIGLNDIAEVSDLLTQHNDEGILFSDKTSRLAARTHMTECICLVSTNYIYFLDTHLDFDDDFNILPISDIIKVITSKESDNAVVIFFGDYKSQLILTPYKIELMMILKNQYKMLTENDLDFEFSNSIEFPVNKDTMLEASFVETKDGVKMTLFCKGY
ncbi:Myosin tail family protein [Tritrichomonas foetus]|uniref:Myosin tail family protein n=1 Tax=Tritrichomonas foetus TaxID=1144522 RepID=A0A1J4KM46_9EUKA|nr:Myosin tail family protein [Tritrichomonas foetus]|eukprot:OHT10766.1 Myosin tail family protein [Tritrichomonas foetus]